MKLKYMSIIKKFKNQTKLQINLFESQHEYKLFQYFKAITQNIEGTSVTIISFDFFAAAPSGAFYFIFFI